MTEDKGILIRNIYYMLAYAFQELRKNNYAEIEGEKFDNIYDLFAEILIRGISYQLKQGLYREYVAKNESMQTIKGKIDINALSPTESVTIGKLPAIMMSCQRIMCTTKFF